ncbi:MAG TPA: SRPBCC domain-containing protein [Thermoanaerobaculia bacterium]
MRKASVTAAVVLLVAASSPAAVVDVSPSGFLVRHELVVAATPEKLYRALTAGIAGWWNPMHTRSGDAKNLSIEPRAGGCFCEKLPGGGAAEHMRVVFVSPPRVLRMVGALGPLQESGLAASMTWTLTAEGTGTKVELTYSVGGYFRGGFEKIAPAVDAVLGDQLSRLGKFAEAAGSVGK